MRDDLAGRVVGLDWERIESDLDALGHAVLGRLLEDRDCDALLAAEREDARFRKRIVMERHGYGRGRYAYFAYPLPEPVAILRAAIYPHLAPIARRWASSLGRPSAYPDDHADYLARCHAAGQNRPTPLVLCYGPGDYNRLHQDLYGELVFPVQVAILLSRPGDDFTGGELVLTEQRARMQSRAEVVPLGRGEAVAFAVADRPVPGRHRPVRVTMRHGVSRIRTGSRATLGIIFHDAR